MYKNKYPLDPELTKIANFKFIGNRFILPLLSFIYKLMPKGIDKSKFYIDYYKVGKIKIHIITPKHLLIKKTPCFFYIHGGGFALREFKGQYQGEMFFALMANSRVIGIDYSLSPKNKFPVALNECFEAYRYILNNSVSLGIDKDNIVIGGDSAGGSLTLDTYIKIKENNLIEPKGLMLIYPVIDHRMTTESMKKYFDTPTWDSRINKKMWDYYLGKQDYICPLERIEEFTVKNMYIEVAEFDCLHDEGIALYNSLTDRVENLVLNDTKGTFHGYDNSTHAKVSIDSAFKRLNFLKDTFNK